MSLKTDDGALQGRAFVAEKSDMYLPPRRPTSLVLVAFFGDGGGLCSSNSSSSESGCGRWRGSTSRGSSCNSGAACFWRVSNLFVAAASSALCFVTSPPEAVNERWAFTKALYEFHGRAYPAEYPEVEEAFQEPGSDPP